WLENRAERPDVAEYETFAAAESFARDPGAGGVDGGEILFMSVAAQHEAAAAKRVRDDAVGAGLGVAPLDREHAVGMREIPRFAARALFKAGEHELRAHRAVADQPAPAGDFMEEFFHGNSWAAGAQSHREIRQA